VGALQRRALGAGTAYDCPPELEGQRRRRADSRENRCRRLVLGARCQGRDDEPRGYDLGSYTALRSRDLPRP
jgi:hypothetical protein